MRKLLLIGLAVTTIIMFSGTAFALSYATNVLWNNTAGVSDPSRIDPDNALGAPDDKFLSIGIDGIAAFDFGMSFDSTAIVFEITWGNRNAYPEYAKVFVGNIFSLDTNDYTEVGTIKNNLDQNVIDLTSLTGNPFQYLLVQDITKSYSDGIATGDGFDIDAVGVSPVPEPATMLLLGSGLLGLAGFSRKRFFKE